MGSKESTPSTSQFSKTKKTEEQIPSYTCVPNIQPINSKHPFERKEINKQNKWNEPIKQIQTQQNNFNLRRIEPKVAPPPISSANISLNLQKSQAKIPVNYDEVVIPQPPVTHLKSFMEINPEDTFTLKPKLGIPFVEKRGQFKINMAKCMYFTQGHNNQYTYDILQLHRIHQDSTQWISVTSEDYRLKANINITKIIGANYHEIESLSRLGTFVLSQSKWAYIIELCSLECIYEGELTNLLLDCMRIPFFQKLLKKYAFYMMEEKKNITIRDLKSTENDTRLNEQELAMCQRLFKHQKQEVGWMLNLQRKPIMNIQSSLLVPVFDSGYFFNPLDKDIKLYKLKKMDKYQQQIPIRGAILASDIGSGKTASILYLIWLGLQFNRNQPVKPTLIVVPDSILYQWAQQIKKFTPNVRCQLFETVDQLKNYGINSNTMIVLVTRRIISQTGSSILKKIPFERIVLDQVHEIVKSLQKSNNNQLYFDGYRTSIIWGVTGTPHHVDYLTNLTILGKLLRFNKEIFEENNINVFRRCFIEHCIRKNTNQNLLPVVKKQLVYSEMQAVESVLYSAKAAFSLDQEQARKICFNILPSFQLHQKKNSLENGIIIVKQKLNKEIQTISQRLKTETESLRKNLQQKLQRLSSESSFYNEIIMTLQKPIFQCIICLDQQLISKLVLTQCLHYCCDDCYNHYFNHLVQMQCAVCKSTIVKGKAIIHPDMKYYKNKIDVIIQSIKNIPKDDKVIIFTQFHNLVERIGQEFQKIGIHYIELKGEPSEINYRLNVFRNDPEIGVLLLSIEQAASGINLTEANHVFFAHPILGNDYNIMIKTYKQCIGRVHRIGQTKPISAKLFICRRTLEFSYSNYFMQ